MEHTHKFIGNVTRETINLQKNNVYFQSFYYYIHKTPLTSSLIDSHCFFETQCLHRNPRGRLSFKRKEQIIFMGHQRFTATAQNLPPSSRRTCFLSRSRRTAICTDIARVVSTIFSWKSNNTIILSRSGVADTDHKITCVLSEPCWRVDLLTILGTVLPHGKLSLYIKKAYCICNIKVQFLIYL